MQHPTSPPAEAAAAPAPGEPAPHYGLPPLPQLPCPDFRGPTPWSNWVIKGRLLAGAYPASLDDQETDRILTTLLELGVNTFVCLQAEFSLHTPEAAWRSGQGLRPYIKDAQRLLIRARETNSHRIKQDKLDFLHLPIIDGNVTSDTALSRLADDCCARLLRGERLYIHCWGGHGRTGTVIAVMLGRLYGATCAASLRFTQAFHDSRKFPQGVRSPQTSPQIAQVKRLLPDPPSLRGVVYPRDPSVLLDDIILRPSSTPPSPTKPSPLAASTAAAAVAAAATSAAADMEVEEAPHLHPVPLNQQRKDAIRAKQGGAMAAPPLGMPAGIIAALQAASLLEAVEKGQQAGQTAGAAGQWCAPAGSGSIAAAHGQAAAGKGSPADAQQGYRQQYVQQQQQQQQQPGMDAPPSKPAGSSSVGGSGKAIFLTASSARGLGQPFDDAAPGDTQQLDMRPSKLTVMVPNAAGGPERSATSMARIMNYISGRSAIPTSSSSAP